MHTTTHTYIQHLYQNVLLRSADAGGLAHWDSAAVAGLTSTSMVKEFIVSAEAKNITALLRLYDVFFNRTADSTGLTGWLAALKGGTNLHDIATAFGSSSEFQTTHSAHSTTQYVEALYSNLFSRASDAAGLAYWVQAIDSGKITRTELALTLTFSDEAKSENGAATRFAESYLALRSTGVAEPATTVVEALAQKSLAAAIVELQTVHGTVQNGIIQNANVFRDSDGNGLPDAGITPIITDANGNFTMVGGFGDFIVTGGIDLTTDKVNDKILSAPSKITDSLGDITMITPLTTVINAMTNQGMNVTTAIAKLNSALGLDANFNPLNFNHTAAAISATSSEAQQKAALAMKGAIAQVTAIMENSAGLIKGVAGTQTNLNAIEITSSVTQALANKIIDITANVTTLPGTRLIALESQMLIKELIISAAAGVNTKSAIPISGATLTSIANFATDVAQIIGGLNSIIKGSVDTINNAATFNASMIIDAFSTIIKTEALGQDAIQSAITTAAINGSLATVVSSFTSANLSAAITATTIGPITPGVASTKGGTVLSNALIAANLLPAPLPTTLTPTSVTDTTAPTLASSSPADNATTVAVGANIVLTFSENLAAGSGNIVISNGSDTRTIAVTDAQVSISGNTVTINPTADLNANSTYYVQMAADVLTDTAGNAYAGIADTTTLNFATPPYTVSGTAATMLVTGAQNITAATDLGGVTTLVYAAGGNAMTMTAAQFQAFTTFTGGAGADGITLSTAIDDGAGGSYNASTKIFTSIADLTFATGTNQIALTRAQHAAFTTITAPGTDTIAISGNGAITARANIETYVLGDDTTNARAVTTTSTALNLVANNASDTVTVNAAALAQNTALTVAAASTSALIVTGLVGDVVATNLSGALTATTANAADNSISITTGSAATSVNVAAGAATDTVAINATALANNVALTATSGTAAAGTVNITGLAGDLIVSNPTSGAIGVAVVDNTIDNGIAITAGASNLAIANVANGDTVTVTGFKGSILTGTIAGTTGKFNITAGTGTSSITTAAGDDTFIFIAGTGLTSADTVNGGAGADTVILTGNTIIAASNFDNVSNIETITLANTTKNVAITTRNTLVAAGTTLTLQANSLTTGKLTFNGAAETDGAFDITGGGNADSITGSAGSDTIAGGAGNDTIAGGAGNDSITGGPGADTITLGNGADDNTRQTVIYSSTSDGAAAGAKRGADTITRFDANANSTTDDLIQITGVLKTAVDDDADGVLDYSTTDGTDGGNQAIVGGANQEATVLLDAEVEIGAGDFTQTNLTNLLAELGEEINFTGIATGQEHLFIINFSATQAGLVLYTAGTGGDDTIVKADIRVLGIVTHNDGTNLLAGDMTF